MSWKTPTRVLHAFSRQFHQRYAPKISNPKNARKTLMKLTPVVIFTNMLTHSFTSEDPKVQKDSRVISLFLHFWDLLV